MGKWYGSIQNRIQEGRNYTGRELKAGDDITTYLYSDRHCYYITDVVDQKHIFVKQYYVCADRDKTGGQGHQDWVYHKTIKEHNEYLSKYFPDHNYKDVQENAPTEWIFRYGHWNTVTRFTQADIDRVKAREGWCFLCARNKKEQALLDAGKEVVRYERITEGISFGVRDYYYDWEF